MPRRNHQRRRKAAVAPAPPLARGEQVDSAPDGEWAYRSVPADRAGKVYRCPGCDHPIAVGVAHIVAWRTDDLHGVEDRRHWHNGCWSARGRRALTRRWS